MKKHTSIPEIDGLFWYYSNTEAKPRPVLINQARWGLKLRSFNGSLQSWLDKGEYLIGPQPAPAAQDSESDDDAAQL
ncbi:MAG: hypothetical protein VW877_17085 [Pseudomonadaceae bacterium]